MCINIPIMSYLIKLLLFNQTVICGGFVPLSFIAIGTCLSFCYCCSFQQLFPCVPSPLCRQQQWTSQTLCPPVAELTGAGSPSLALSFRVLRHANRGPRGSYSSCKLIPLMLLLWVMMGPWEGSFAHSRFSVYSPCICANHSVSLWFTSAKCFGSKR